MLVRAVGDGQIRLSVCCRSLSRPAKSPDVLASEGTVYAQGAPGRSCTDMSRCRLMLPPAPLPVHAAGASKSAASSSIPCYLMDPREDLKLLLAAGPGGSTLVLELH